MVNANIQSIAVIGAGTMGSGIALTAAQNGFRAYQIDVAAAALNKAREYHAKTVARHVEKQRLTEVEAAEVLARISYHRELSEGAAADFTIEAATENRDLKRKIFGQMKDIFRNDVVMATNTSSISITDLAASVGDAAHRVIGMHFFNPVPVMKLVEVIKGLATDEATAATTIALAERLGKTPIPVNDRAGFVSNRILMPMINEAFYAWMEGVAGPEHIDQIMQLGMAHPMGPLRLADLIGLDVCHDILMVLYEELGQDKYFPCPKLRQLVRAGRLGNKSGRGVYDYS